MKITDTVEYKIGESIEEFKSWKYDPVTKDALKVIESEVTRWSLGILNGETLGDNIAQDTARAIGYIEGLKFLAGLLSGQLVASEEET